jgi:hypothetical protein
MTITKLKSGKGRKRPGNNKTLVHYNLREPAKRVFATVDYPNAVGVDCVAGLTSLSDVCSLSCIESLCAVAPVRIRCNAWTDRTALLNFCRGLKFSLTCSNKSSSIAASVVIQGCFNASGAVGRMAGSIVNKRLIKSRAKSGIIIMQR